MRSKEYDEGFISFKKNKGSYINPYSSGTTKKTDFEKGWTQAIRKEPSSSFRNGQYVLADSAYYYQDTKPKKIQLRSYSKK